MKTPNPKTKGGKMTRYQKITYRAQKGNKTVILKVSSESNILIIGTRVNNEGDDFSKMVRGVEHTETFVLDKSHILKSFEMKMSKKYGLLERIK